MVAGIALFAMEHKPDRQLPGVVQTDGEKKQVCYSDAQHRQLLTKEEANGGTHEEDTRDERQQAMPEPISGISLLITVKHKNTPPYLESEKNIDTAQS
jgi:hypothetical protein